MYKVGDEVLCINAKMHLDAGKPSILKEGNVYRVLNFVFCPRCGIQCLDIGLGVIPSNAEFEYVQCSNCNHTYQTSDYHAHYAVASRFIGTSDIVERYHASEKNQQTK